MKIQDSPSLRTACNCVSEHITPSHLSFFVTIVAVACETALCDCLNCSLVGGYRNGVAENKHILAHQYLG